MYVPHKKCSACNRLIQLQLIADSLTDKLNLYETTLNRKSEMLRYITSDYHNQIVYVSENKIGDICTKNYSNIGNGFIAI